MDLLIMSQREILQGSESLTNASPMQTRTHGDSRCGWKQGTRMKSGPLCEALTVPNKDCCAVPGTYKFVKMPDCWVTRLVCGASWAVFIPIGIGNRHSVHVLASSAKAEESATVNAVPV